jgi:hypothetical protein
LQRTYFRLAAVLLQKCCCTSRLAAVLQVMRFQLGFGGLFPAIEKSPFRGGQAAQARQIASARLGFAKRIDEPFAFLTAYPSG